MGGGSKRRSQRCRVCHGVGHNRTSCPVRKHVEKDGNRESGNWLSMENEVDEEIFDELMSWENVSTLNLLWVIVNLL